MMLQQKSVTLNPGESKQVAFQVVPTEVRAYSVTVDGLSGSFSIVPAPPPPAVELIDAYFNDGRPMIKQPGGSFAVTLKIKNNLTKDWSPSNILYGFGHKTDGDVSPSSIVWGRNPITWEVDPNSCGAYGFWPVANWPVIPAGTTKTFTTDYGFCPGASEGIYDGFIQMTADGATQTIILPAILTIIWPKPKLAILNAVLRDCTIGIKYGVYKIYGTVDLSVRNDEGRTLSGGSPDDVNIEVYIYRVSDGARVGFVRLGKVDIPPGINTLALTPKIGFESEVPLTPGLLNYRLRIKIIFAGWPGKPYVQAEFTGSIILA